MRNFDNNLSFEDIKKIMLEEYINDYHLLYRLIKPTIGIRESKKQKISKFGGNPLIPSGFDVNKHIDKSLSFLCQIAINEYSFYDEYNYLPTNKMLYFFVNPKLNYPVSKKDFKVICLSYEKEPLKEYNGNSIKFNEIFIEFFKHYNFPSYQSYERIDMEDENFEFDQKIEEIQEFINEHNSITLGCEGSQLYGNPQALQGTVSYHWAIKSLGFNHPLSVNNIEDIKREEKGFNLLLQVDFSDINTTNLFSDGLFYFGIKHKDLSNYNFDNVELVCQAT